MKKLSLILLPLLVAFVIGLDLNHQMFSDASAFADADSQEEVSESDDSSEEQDRSPYKISGGGDDHSDSQWQVTAIDIAWPDQKALTCFCAASGHRATTVSTRLPYTFSRPELFILYHNIKTFPA